MPQIDGVSAIAVILIASFGVDRIVTGLLFTLSFIEPYRRIIPDPHSIQDSVESENAKRKQKLVYFVLAGILSGVVVAYLGNVRIFQALGFTTNDILDSIMTGLILVAGADRIAGFSKMAGGPNVGNSASQPIEITGKLILEGEVAKKL